MKQQKNKLIIKCLVRFISTWTQHTHTYSEISAYFFHRHEQGSYILGLLVKSRTSINLIFKNLVLS